MNSYFGLLGGYPTVYFHFKLSKRSGVRVSYCSNLYTHIGSVIIGKYFRPESSYQGLDTTPGDSVDVQYNLHEVIHPSIKK